MSSIRRSIQALDLLARKGPLGVRAVAQQLGLPLGSVHRLLLDLAEEGVVERTAEGEWELSFRLLEITGLQLDRLQFSRLAQPLCRKDRRGDEGDRQHQCAQRHGRRLHRQGARQRGHAARSAGSARAARCIVGGAGKAMLAFLNEADQQRVIEAAPLVALTPKTITNPKLLREELIRIRQRGYSIDDQEVVIGRLLRRHADPRPQRASGRSAQHHRPVAEAGRSGGRAARGHAERGVRRHQPPAWLHRRMAARRSRRGRRPNASRPRRAREGGRQCVSRG